MVRRIDHANNASDATNRAPPTQVSARRPAVTPTRTQPVPPASARRWAVVEVAGGAGAADQVTGNTGLAPAMAHRTVPGSKAGTGPHHAPPLSNTHSAHSTATAPKNPASRNARRAMAWEATTRRPASSVMAR